MSWNDRGIEALAVTMARLDNNSDTNRPADLRLKGLARSIISIAQELETVLKSADQPNDALPSTSAHPTKKRPNLSELALKAYRDRRRRADIFGDDALFGEPAWDILLDLFVAGEKHKRVGVTSACIGSGVPSTTALRWLSVLETRGLVEREYDEQDARRSFVRLTPKGRECMVTYLSFGQN